MPAIKGNPVSPTLGSLGERWEYVVWTFMFNIFMLMTTDGERKESEYDYFYDAIVKDDLAERKKLFASHTGSFMWTVTWSRENERFEYVGEGRTFGFGIDDIPPTPEDLDHLLKNLPFGWSTKEDPVVVVEGELVSDEGVSVVEASAPPLKAIIT